MLEDIIKNNRPNISQSSIKTYLSAVKTVGSAIKQTLNSPDDVVKYHENIIDYLSSQKLNVRKTKLSAFVVLLDKGKKDGKTKNSDEIEKVLDKFRSIITKDGEDYEKLELKQTLTDTQKKNFIPWKDVLKIYEDLKIESEPLFKLERLTQQQFNKLQNFVLLSLYVLIPPRRSLDYSSFKLRNINEKEDNYLTIKGKKKVATFVFNKYKNSGRLGSQNVVIPNNLRNIILKWKDKNPYDYLIVNTKGEQVTQSKINLLLNNIFGKNISSSLLRHIYLTEHFGNVNLQDITDVTKAMGNNGIDRTLKYVSKENK